MGLVFSYADARAERIKAKLLAFADSGAPGMVETRNGVIGAKRIFCRKTVAVLIDRYGVQTRLGYGEITDVSPVLPAAEIMAFANWQVTAAEEQPAATTVVRFPINRSV